MSRIFIDLMFMQMGQEHLLLGMIAEADTGEGYFESGVDVR